MRKIGYSHAGMMMGLVGLLVMLTFASPVSAQANVPITITTSAQVDSIYSIYNTNNQIVDFSVSGGTEISGAEMFVQINDGGVDNDGSSTGPTINPTNGIDMTGGIFYNNNPGNEGFTISNDHMMAYDGINTNGGNVAASGLLGTLNLNATGITPGTQFTVQFFNVGENYAPFNFGSSSEWASGINETPFTGDGMGPAFLMEVVAVPEPTTGILVVGSVLWLLGRRLSKKTRSAA